MKHETRLRDLGRGIGTISLYRENVQKGNRQALTLKRLWQAALDYDLYPLYLMWVLYLLAATCLTSSQWAYLCHSHRPAIVLSDSKEKVPSILFKCGREVCCA